MSSFVDNYMILNNEKFTEENLYDSTRKLLEAQSKGRASFYEKPSARIFYNKSKKWICIYFTAAFISRTTIDGLRENVAMLSEYYGTTVVNNQVLETNTLLMTMHGETSGMCAKDPFDFYLVEDAGIKMEFDKWKHLFECDESTVAKILEAEYDDETNRVKDLWVQLGFDEIIVMCDNLAYDWLIDYQADKIKDFTIIEV